MSFFRWFRESPRALAWLVAGQFVLAGLLLSLPFGFDHPSELGLDFGHFLLGLALYVVLMIGGVVAAGARGKWPWAGLQVLAPCVVAGMALLGVIAI